MADATTDDVTYQEIRYEVADPVATIWLDRPDQLNAWTQRMASEVRHAVRRAEADPAVVAIILTGAGRAFCAGADMGNLTALTEGGELDDAGPLDVAPVPDLPEDFAGEYTYLLATTKPIIAAINGPVAGMAVPLHARRTFSKPARSAQLWENITIAISPRCNWRLSARRPR